MMFRKIKHHNILSIFNIMIQCSPDAVNITGGMKSPNSITMTIPDIDYIND